MDTDALREIAARIDRTRDTPLPTAWDDARDAVIGLRRSADEVDRLRAVIENAPHDRTICAWAGTFHENRYPCTCWKADVLN